MARHSITYKEAFKCPYCEKEAIIHVPNATVAHPCRVKNTLKLVKLESVNVWRKEETEEKEVYKQGILNL